MMKNIYFAILCGGGGERLWPLSRKKRPKQFIPFLKDSSLLEQTIDRISPISVEKNNITIVTTKNQIDLVLPHVKDKIGFIIDEPDSRNTGPAILFSCFQIAQKNPNAVIVFLPADSFVHQNDKYQNYLKVASDYASKNEKIVTLGVTPTRAATCYGYIQADCKIDERIDCGKIYEVANFHEKPDLQLSEKYLLQGNMFWNISVFAAKVSVFLKEFENYAPELFYSMQKYLKNEIEYQDIVNISIDYAVMEKTKKVVVLPCDFDWTDVGSLDEFLILNSLYSKNLSKIINVDCDGNLAFTSSSNNKEKIVTFIGVNDLCLVEDDDVILIAKKSEVGKVKKALAQIREKSLETFL